MCWLSNSVSCWFLEHIRYANGSRGSTDDASDNEDSDSETNCLSAADTASLEIKGATVTFRNVNYSVKASTTKDKLHLLKGISGYFERGTMTALMGSTGAGML